MAIQTVGLQSSRRPLLLSGRSAGGPSPPPLSRPPKLCRWVLHSPSLVASFLRSFAKIGAGGGLKETISSGMAERGMPACKMEMRGDGARKGHHPHITSAVGLKKCKQKEQSQLICDSNMGGERVKKSYKFVDDWTSYAHAPKTNGAGRAAVVFIGADVLNGQYRDIRPRERREESRKNRPDRQIHPTMPRKSQLTLI